MLKPVTNPTFSTRFVVSVIALWIHKYKYKNMNTLAGLGMPDTSKTDEFSEKFQTAFDPPSFSENHVAVFFLLEIHDRSIVYNGKNLQNKFLD